MEFEVEPHDFIDGGVVFAHGGPVAFAFLLGLLRAEMHTRGPGNAARGETAAADLRVGADHLQRSVEEQCPAAPPVFEHAPARRTHVKFAGLLAVHAVFIDAARGQHQMAVAVFGVTGPFVDGPPDGDAVVLPQPPGVLGHQIDLPVQVQFAGKRQDQRAGHLGVPVALGAFGRLPIHRARVAGEENLLGLAGIVVHEARALVHLAAPAGVGPRRHRRFAILPGYGSKLEVIDRHANVRSNQNAKGHGCTTCERFLGLRRTHCRSGQC